MSRVARLPQVSGLLITMTVNRLEAQEAADVSQSVTLVGYLAWPLTVLVLALFLRKPVVRFLDHLAALIGRGRALRVNVGSASIAIEAERSEELLGAMLELVKGMTMDERKLFRIILDQPPKGLKLTEAFERSSEYHATLRSLRDRNLVQPAERGAWHPGKHAAVTRIGNAILGVEKLREQMLADGLPSWWKPEYEGGRFRGKNAT